MDLRCEVHDVFVIDNSHCGAGKVREESIIKSTSVAEPVIVWGSTKAGYDAYARGGKVCSLKELLWTWLLVGLDCGFGEWRCRG